jgi:hypothetical protein
VTFVSRRRWIAASGRGSASKRNWLPSPTPAAASPKPHDPQCRDTRNGGRSRNVRGAGLTASCSPASRQLCCQWRSAISCSRIPRWLKPLAKCSCIPTLRTLCLVGGAGKPSEGRVRTGLDWDNLAEEIESLGRSQRSEIRSRLVVILLHLLKWNTSRANEGRLESVDLRSKEAGQSGTARKPELALLPGRGSPGGNMSWPG